MLALPAHLDGSPSRRRHEARRLGVKSYADAHDFASSTGRDAGQRSALNVGHTSRTEDEWTVANAAMRSVMQALGYAIQEQVS